MRLATRRDGSPDGALVVVSADGTRVLPTGTSLLSVMSDWVAAEPDLQALAAMVETEGKPFDPARLAAPLPRTWQWLDGSAFESHGDLMAKVFGMDPAPRDRPLMYQGLSDRFYGPADDVPFASEEDGIDFEGEFGVILDAVPMGCDVETAARHIRLIVQINDWSLRKIAPTEMKTGFGWIQAKPPCGMAPFAVTPDELGSGWRDGRVALPLIVDWNGERFGAANGHAMGFSFAELIVHAARTRDLVAGTIIGSGTVSNANYREIGSSCIAERRGVELLDFGEARTPFMRFGDTVRMEAAMADGRAPFGAIEQKAVRA